jgi:ribonucleoside-diphosphate reductase alpha chain
MKRYRSCCVSAGGFHLFSHLGILEELEHRGVLDSVRTFSGCSAGALVAFAVLSGIPPRKAAESVKTFMHTDLAKIKADGGLQILDTFGYIDSKRAICALCNAIGLEDPTFHEFYQRTHKTFYVTAYCLNTQQPETFSHHTHPDMKVRLAVRMSCCIPLVFTPVKVKQRFYVDGFFRDYVPTRPLTEEDHPVLCMDARQAPQDTELIQSFPQYLGAVVKALVQEIMWLQAPEDNHHHDSIKVTMQEAVEWMGSVSDPNALRDMAQKYFDSGRADAQQFLLSRNDVDIPPKKTMQVQKRDGSFEPVAFEKIFRRIQSLCDGLSPLVDPTKIAQKVITSLHENVRTYELDELAAEEAVGYATSHPDYATLAARIAVSNCHKSTHDSFLKTTELLFEAGIVSEEHLQVVRDFTDALQAALQYDRDYDFDFFGFKTLERSYLYKIHDVVVERPQHMWMRVAIGIHDADLAKVLETYEAMSTKKLTHATPTLFNAGTNRPQMSSCFLLDMEDSISNIYKTLGDCAQISKFCGGIGLNITNVRARGGYIQGTHGKSSGIVPMLKVFNDTARYVNQGGKRLGSFAAYIQPWHADVLEFLDMKKNTGSEYERARDLFYAMWIPDLFMKRVQEDAMWSLFSPEQTPDLAKAYGDEFERLYAQYEAAGVYVKQVKAQTVWFRVLDSLIETGSPYVMFKDSVNRKSNQKNVGTIQSSNLCAEIVEYTSPDEVAVCNLASVCLPSFVNATGHTFDFAELGRTVELAIRNLDRVIDRNFYPVIEAERSNMRHRPVGLGVQGLADVYILMGFPWESDEAAEINRNIFEVIYFHAVKASAEMAQEKGSYETFAGSPASQGVFQFDMWETPRPKGIYSDEDWEQLRETMKRGMRNSLLTALMPTASTAQVMGNTEAMEPIQSNIFLRKVLSGEFVVVNKHLVKDLQTIGKWNDTTKNEIIRNNGSVQSLDIPDALKKLYKTVWELSMRSVIEQSADRGRYVCQSQSLNLFVPSNRLNYKSLSSMYFYAWQKGLKGCYYLRSQAAIDPIKYSLPATNNHQAPKEEETECLECSA